MRSAATAPATGVGSPDHDSDGLESPGHRRLAEIADIQHGVVAVWQLIANGFTRGWIEHAIRVGRLYQLFRGVYVVGRTSVTGLGRIMAAVLACGPGAVASHQTAALLYGILKTSRALIDVTTPRSRHGYRGIKVHRSRALHPDITDVDGIPVTSLARTLLDLAEVLSPRQLARVIEDAEKLRILDLRAIDELLARSGGRRGVTRLRKALVEYVEPPITQEELERRFAEMCDDEGIPRGESNVMVEGWVVDRLWREPKVIVELDSREHHMTTLAFERDRLRDVDLQLAGYRVIRTTWRRLHTEREQVVAQLRRALASGQGALR